MNERSEECGGKPSSNASGCSQGGDTPAAVPGRSHDMRRSIIKDRFVDGFCCGVVLLTIYQQVLAMIFAK